MSNPQLSALVSVKETAVYLQVSTQTVRRWAREGFLQYVRVGNAYRIVRDSLPKIPMQQGNVEKLERRGEP